MHRLTRPERRSRIQHRQSQVEIALLHTAVPPAADRPARRKRRWWPVALFLLVCLLGSGAVSYGVFAYVAPAIPRELAGTWQVTEGPLKGSTLEFRADATVVATSYERGKKATVTSAVKVEGKKMYLTARDELGKDETLIQTIIRLTDDELIITDQDRHVYRMKRVGG
jgi:uncharacterized protein (TIGR03066 family)